VAKIIGGRFDHWVGIVQVQVAFDCSEPFIIGATIVLPLLVLALLNSQADPVATCYVLYRQQRISLLDEL
jgi:hypothetical protein